MGLFGRRGSTQAREESPVDEVVDETVTEDAAPVDVPEHGPWDLTQQPSARDTRVDLGAILLPGVQGMQVRMELDKATNAVTGVSVLVEESVLQIQAFAAPRTEGIWDEIREEIAESLKSQGAKVDDIPGRFGRELFVQAPAKDLEGKPAIRVVRFLGVDGPRWFLRGVITGRASTDTKAAGLIEALFSQIVVVRDDVARAPRELLPLHLPQSGAGADGEPDAAATPEGAADTDKPATPEFNPLERGPEITEIR